MLQNKEVSYLPDIEKDIVLQKHSLSQKIFYLKIAQITTNLICNKTSLKAQKTQIVPMTAKKVTKSSKMCQNVPKMSPKSVKSWYYSVSRQNSVKFCKDFAQFRIFYTNIVGTLVHFFPIPATNNFVICQLGSGQPLTVLWFFNLGPAKYKLFCDFSTVANYYLFCEVLHIMVYLMVFALTGLISSGSKKISRLGCKCNPLILAVAPDKVNCIQDKEKDMLEGRTKLVSSLHKTFTFYRSLSLLSYIQQQL